ncbi:MAG: cytochrome c3 family protein [Phycisphaerales bacterium]|nr:cytochrome c3 family protein [Phycisphaerales bacterium]
MNALRMAVAVLAFCAVIAAALFFWSRLPDDAEAAPGDVVNSVTSFATRHPEWAVLREGRQDEATIRLNHARHLDPDTPGMQEALLAVANDPDAHIVSIGGSERLSMSCASCHRPEPGGWRMKPIRFDAHCARCHTDQLARVPSITPEGQGDAIRVPHGAPARVVEQIERALATAAAFAESRFSPEEEAESARPSRGRRQPAGAAAPLAVPRFADRAEATQWLASQRERLLQQVANGCAYCHAGMAAAMEPPGSFHVAPPAIPSSWLPRAQFSHRSHEMLSCVQCHTQARTSVSTLDVMLPGVASCRECHNPRAGAPSSCTVCHTYHQPTPYHEGGTLSIEEFTRRERRSPAAE